MIIGNMYRIFAKLTILIIQQKLLFIVFAVILIMVLYVGGLSLNTNDKETKTLNNQPLNQSAARNSQQSVPLSANAPSPTNIPLTTKFIYFIGSFFKATPGPTLSPSQNYRSKGQSAVYPTSTQQQTTSNNSANQSGNSGGGYSPGSQAGSEQEAQQDVPTLTSAPPPTSIDIVFINENGGYFTYVPPDVPPIDVTWVKYINYQDHYSIEYPVDWLVVKSSYNGHEGITLYMPGDQGNIDKPSIAFVGWNANYLTSTAKYTGQIILNGTPGTIYTNGPLGPSSIAAVFQYPNGYFALGSSTSGSIFIYVFDHMLRSLEFNV